MLNLCKNQYFLSVLNLNNYICALLQNLINMKRIFLSISLLVFGYAAAQQNIFFDRDFWKTKPTVDVIKQKISEGNDPTALNGAAFDATSLAIMNGAPYETITYLLSLEGNEVNKRTHDKRTYIFWAGMPANIQITKYLLEKGADVNVKDTRMATALLFSASRGNTNTEYYDLLLKNGANIKEVNAQGADALLISVANFKDIKEADYFIKKGLSFKSADNEGNNAIHYASRNGNSAIISQLISKKIKASSLNNKKENAMFAAAEGSRGKQNTLDFFKYLEGLKISPNQKNIDGNTPLINASKGNKETAVISYFIEKGNDVNQADKKGNTPLSYASFRNSAEVVSLLLSKKANVNIKNNEGQSPVNEAVRGNSAKVVSLLIENGADIHVKDNEGNSLAYYLVNSYNPRDAKNFDEKWEVLAKNGLKFNQIQSNSNSLYHLAVENGNIDLLKKVASVGIDINTKNSDGLTPLHKAVMSAKNMEIIEFLLKNGANKSIKTDFGETVFELASENELLRKFDLTILK